MNLTVLVLVLADVVQLASIITNCKYYRICLVVAVPDEGSFKYDLKYIAAEKKSFPLL